MLIELVRDRLDMASQNIEDIEAVRCSMIMDSLITQYIDMEYENTTK